jgi:DNA primase
MIEQNVIDQIRSNNNIIDIINTYIPLKRSGSNYKARCPFHDEKTASFMVSEKKQIFKCFGCGKSGNVITFVRDYEHISFYEALKKLAERAGIQIEFSDQKNYVPTEKEQIYSAYALANDFFQKNFSADQALRQNFLRNRLISQNTAEKFSLGYALNSYGGLWNYLLKKGIKPDILRMTGLFGGDPGKEYDIFRHRIMFPIHGKNSKINAFGGRVLSKDQPGGKYINSPTTPIYTKGNELYGFYQTKYEIGKKNQAIICEGYMDFLRLYDNGVTNCCAALGTALTDQQISLISRFTGNMIIMFDGDKAGAKAAIRAASNVIRLGFSAKIVLLPEGEDPDSYLETHTLDDLMNIVDKSLSLPEFIYRNINLQINVKDKLSILTETISRITDEISRELFANEIADLFKVSVHSLLAKAPTARKKLFNSAIDHKERDHYLEERNLIKLILNDPDNINYILNEIDSSFFFSEKYLMIFTFFTNNRDNLSDVSQIIGNENTAIDKQVLAEISMEENDGLDISKVIEQLKLRKLKHELNEVNQKILKDPENIEHYVAKKDIQKKLREFSNIVVKKSLF